MILMTIYSHLQSSTVIYSHLFMIHTLLSVARKHLFKFSGNSKVFASDLKKCSFGIIGMIISSTRSNLLPHFGVLPAGRGSYQLERKTLHLTTLKHFKAIYIWVTQYSVVEALNKIQTSSIFSKNSEANTLEFLENLEELFPW